MSKLHTTHVEIAHRTHGRVRLRVARQHRSIDKMDAMRSALLELNEIVHAVRVDTITGSIVIHHNDSEDLFLHLSLVLAQFGLSIALDEPVPSDGAAPSAWGSLLLLVAQPVVDWAIDCLGLGVLHRVFLIARFWLHLQRVWHQGAVQLPALALFALDAHLQLGRQSACA